MHETRLTNLNRNKIKEPEPSNTFLLPGWQPLEGKDAVPASYLLSCPCLLLPGHGAQALQLCPTSPLTLLKSMSNKPTFVTDSVLREAESLEELQKEGHTRICKIGSSLEAGKGKEIFTVPSLKKK